jgi:hypothetical protein
MMDNYSALLCCAFIHAELVESLCYLSVHGAFTVATKARRMLVSFLLVVAKIFPDGTCAELITLPSLLEFSAVYAPTIKPSHAHKASQVLIALADALSMAPFEPLSASGVENRINNVTLSPPGVNQSQSAAQSSQTMQVSVRNQRSASTAGPSSVMSPGSLGPSIVPSSLAPSMNPAANTNRTYAVGAGLGGQSVMSRANIGPGSVTPGGPGNGDACGISCGPVCTVANIRDLAEELRMFTRTRVLVSQQQQQSTAVSSGGRATPPLAQPLLPRSSTGDRDTFIAGLVSSSNLLYQPGGRLTSQGSKSRGICSMSKSEYMQQLRVILTPSIDKNDFNKQMELSRVIGKDVRNLMPCDIVNKQTAFLVHILS